MFKLQKLLNNMDENIKKGEAKAIRAVTQAYEDNLVSSKSENEYKKYVDREIKILKGNKLKRDRDVEEVIARWK